MCKKVSEGVLVQSDSDYLGVLVGWKWTHSDSAGQECQKQGLIPSFYKVNITQKVRPKIKESKKKFEGSSLASCRKALFSMISIKVLIIIAISYNNTCNYSGSQRRNFYIKRLTLVIASDFAKQLFQLHFATK